MISSTSYRCWSVARMEINAQLFCNVEWAPAQGLLWGRYHVKSASQQLVILVFVIHGCGLRLLKLLEEERI